MRMTRSAKWHDPGSTGFRNKEKTHCTENPERMKREEQTLEGPKIQKWHKHRGLRQWLQGSKRIKDLGDNWLLCLKEEKGTAIGIRGWSSEQ
jgi:hypothetical protein